MKYSDNAMCAILLCSHISIESKSELKPLTLVEWNNFLKLMQATGDEPGVVLRHDFNGASCFADYPEMWEKVKNLLTRGGLVALELEKLEKKGINVVTIFDNGYPKLLKRRLLRKAPPLLYYAGNLELAEKVGISVVGSRNVDQKGIDFTCQLVEKASKEKLVIYTGGARGVDSISEQTAINSGGAAISFLADSLLNRTRRKGCLDELINGNLLLVSDVNPDSGFSVSRAMNRNKYIYTSGCGAFVVSSDFGKGGTWAGATEAIKHRWTNVYVWDHAEYKGNSKLIEQGAIPFEISEEKLVDILAKNKTHNCQVAPEKGYEQLSLFDVR